MNREEIIRELQSANIADIIFDDESQQPPFRIKTIIMADGHFIDLTSGKKTHPAYEQELTDFIAKIEQATYNTSFSCRFKYLGLDEMRRLAAEHAKKIRANAGNVGVNFRDEYIVRIGENVADIRR